MFKASVKLTTKNDHGQDDIKKLFIKIGVSGDNPYAGFTQLSKVDIREVQVYQDELRQIVAFEKKTLGKSELEQTLPKVYAAGYDASDKNRGLYIVMEDLTVDHQMASIGNGLTKEQTVAALKATARFHAISHCWQQKQGKTFPADMRTVIPMFADCQDTMSYFVDNMDLAIKDLESNPKTKHLIPQMKKIAVDYKGFFKKTMSIVDDTFLIHDIDVWCNNIMFGKLETNKALTVKLYDWQFFSSGPPGFDFALLVSTGLEPGNAEAWMDQLIDGYFDKLTATFEEFQCEPPFSKDEFIHSIQTMGFVTVFNFMMTAYDALWRTPGMAERFIWVLENTIKHCPELKD